MKDLKGKRVLVVGLGRSGISASRLLLQRGATVVATDRRPLSVLPGEARALEKVGVKIRAGQHFPEDFITVDMVVVSPGVDTHMSYLDLARERGVPVIGELELSSWFIEEPLIAITGSNGKSTTTTLISQMLKQSGKKIFTGGNIGIPLAEYALQGIKQDYIVVEVSSFQLETTGTFSPFISILLNITPDHMDRYRDLKEYMETKYRIFNIQKGPGYAILNMDDPLCKDMSNIPGRYTIYFSRRHRVKKGVYIDRDHIVTTIGGEPVSIISVKEIALQGVHNLENAMAATAGALLAGCGPESIRDVLKEFRGLEHRMEFVREIGGVRFINDSKGTNVGAVMKSLEGFDRPVVLIGGGRDKNGDFSPLKPLIKEKVRLLILLGEAKEKIKKTLNGMAPVILVDTMEEAVRTAYNHAHPGDVVLLSPGCASFDMFRNFEERGRIFKEIVWSLHEKR